MWVRAYQFIQVLPEVTFNCCNSSDPLSRDFTHRSCASSTPHLSLNELTFPNIILFPSPVTSTRVQRTTFNVICKINLYERGEGYVTCLGVMQFSLHWMSVVSLYHQQQLPDRSKGIFHSWTQIFKEPLKNLCHVWYFWVV